MECGGRGGHWVGFRAAGIDELFSWYRHSAGPLLGAGASTGVEIAY